MKNLIRNLKVPTGNICVMMGEKDLPIEYLSIGDYGKDHNIKADFLGLNKEIKGVTTNEIMSLSEKWVITISSQYGCSMNCSMCDVPRVGKGVNATYNDLTNQLLNAIKLHPEITHTKRLNVHYARMGEPTFNTSILEHAKKLKEIIKPHLGDSLVHPVISTMLPKSRRVHLENFIFDWCHIKNTEFKGDAGIQFSINSTDNNQRKIIFSNNSLDLFDISDIGERMPNPIGRKYTLNFALTDDSIINAKRLHQLFDPNKFMVKITPIHITAACKDNGIKTTGGYDTYIPYKKVEQELKAEGFDVLVFIPSKDEDDSLITCGNAILSGSTPKTNYEEV
jgi:23S rRNA (adenine2503-C2)-methyltransferase